MKTFALLISLFCFLAGTSYADKYSSQNGIQVTRSAQAEDDAIVDHYKQMSPWGMNV